MNSLEAIGRVIVTSVEKPAQALIADPTNYGDKPIVFFDIDGVINRIPFKERYVGEPCSCPSQSLWINPCTHVSNKNNWLIERVELHPDLYDDVPATPAEGIKVNPQGFKTWISKELAANILGLYKSNTASIIFLTHWEDRSHYLAQYLGIEAPYLPLKQKLSSTGTEMKRSALVSFLRQIYQLKGKIPAFCWLDDEATETPQGVTFRDEFTYWFTEEEIAQIKELLIRTELTEGIRRSQWQQLLDFIAAEQGGNNKNLQNRLDGQVASG